MLTMPGSQGEMIKMLPLTVVISILISYVAAMVAIPVLATLLFKKSKNANRTEKSKGAKLIDRAVRFSIKRPVAIIVGAFILLGISGAIMTSTVGVEMLPELDQPIVYIEFESETYNPIETTIMHEQINAILDVDEDVDTYISTVGGSLPTIDSTLPSRSNLAHQGQIIV